jgi:prepilin-type N-terminal cleavage/methylation domain-containing protein
MRKQKGFTLIELLVVISIIGLLSTMAVVSLNNARQKSRDAKRISDVRQIQTALELYYNDANGYPMTTSLVASGLELSYDGIIYMGHIPTAPIPADCATNNTYTYTTLGTTGTTYELTYCLGGTTGGVSGDIHTASPIGIQ